MEKRFTLISSYVAGTFHNDQLSTSKLKIGDVLVCWREPQNKHDKNAVRLDDRHGHKIGYIQRGIAPVIAALMDNGYEIGCTVTGCGDGDVYIDVTLPIIESP